MPTELVYFSNSCVEAARAVADVSGEMRCGVITFAIGFWLIILTLSTGCLRFPMIRYIKINPSGRQ